MNYKMEKTLHEGVLKLTLRGEANQENADQIAQDVIAAGRGEGVKSLLIDVRELHGRLSVGETFFHVKRFSTGPTKRVAVVDLPENASYYRFHENTAANAGRVLRYFNEIEAAQLWLRGGKAD